MDEPLCDERGYLRLRVFLAACQDLDGGCIERRFRTEVEGLAKALRAVANAHLLVDSLVGALSWRDDETAAALEAASPLEQLGSWENLVHIVDRATLG